MKKVGLVKAAVILVAAIVIGFGVTKLFDSFSLPHNTHGWAKIGELGSAHEHADFAVYINGEMLNFSQEKYMVRSKYVHIEEMNGNIIHKHATGITLGYFLDSLGMKFNNSCFVLDSGTSYCNNSDKTLKLYVNGRINYLYGEHGINNLDKYLISYGNDSEEDIQEQLASVTDDAMNLGG